MGGLKRNLLMRNQVLNPPHLNPWSEKGNGMRYNSGVLMRKVTEKVLCEKVVNFILQVSDSVCS